MYFIYGILTNIIFLFSPLIFIFRLLKKKEDINRFQEKYCIYSNKNFQKTIWFHAVSLGEVISSKKIISKICKNNEVILTVSTPTGLREAKKIYGDKLVVIYSPWDFLIFINNFYKKF